MFAKRREAVYKVITAASGGTRSQHSRVRPSAVYGLWIRVVPRESGGDPCLTPRGFPCQPVTLAQPQAGFRDMTLISFRSPLTPDHPPPFPFLSVSFPSSLRLPLDPA
ncbi:hypothetical protein BaRGS_00034432 [Batillaria attramentaria]|uniref:Uncharacterized protein n=1 Tax=Batillaria attramentaria TaxID=370345 RepID=A0ABD0JHB3_9CAEN